MATGLRDALCHLATDQPVSRQHGEVMMPHVAMVEYEAASPEVRAVYDEILAVRGQDAIKIENICNNFSKIRKNSNF